MEKNEIFENLIRLKTETHTALFSDDYSSVKRDEETYQKALSSQDLFTNEEITKESKVRWSKMIQKMNTEYHQK